MSSDHILTLISLVIILSLYAEEALTSNTNATSTENSDTFEEANDKISRRIIDDRLTPPRIKDFSLWNKRLPLGDIHRLNPPPLRIIENIDDNVTDKAVPKKIRTVGPTQEPSCCNNKLPSANGLSDEKDKSQQKLASEALDLEQGVGAGPVPRFHGNNPTDDRYGQGWRSFNYLGFNKDRGYYDQRNYYPYDRYSTLQRPSSSYAVDGDRFGTVQRPISTMYGGVGDRYGSSTSNRPGNYQNANYGFSHGSGSGTYDRPRPGIGNFGLTTNVAGEGDSDYLYSEGGSSTGGSPSNLQTQKAVALKALAGVALIGAAAALATNPVFLPISVISGRRKRSLQFDNYALEALLQTDAHTKPNKVTNGQNDRKRKGARRDSSTRANITMRQELVISPQCVARLACHVHRDYLDELEKTKIQLLNTQGNLTGYNPDGNAFPDLENWFDSLIHDNILVSDSLSVELKSLIKSAVAVGSNKKISCDEFSCLNVHESSNKKLPNFSSI